MCGNSVENAILLLIMLFTDLNGFAKAEYFVHASRIFAPLLEFGFLKPMFTSVVRSGVEASHLKL